MNFKRYLWALFMKISLLSLVGCHHSDFYTDIHDEGYIIPVEKSDWSFKISSKTNAYNVKCSDCNFAYILISNEVSKKPRYCLWCNRKVKVVKFRFIPFKYETREETQLILDLFPDDYDFKELANPWYSGEIPPLTPEQLDPTLKATPENAYIFEKNGIRLIIPKKR